MQDVQEAVRRVSAATGIEFHYDGPSDEIPDAVGSPTNPIGTAIDGRRC